MTTDNKSFLNVLNGETGRSPPIWLMRQAGRYLAEYRKIRAEVGSFLDLCYSPEHATEVTLQPIRRFGFDAAILFSDILVVPHGLGQDVRFVEGQGPKLPPIRSAVELSALSVTAMQSSSGPLEPVYEAVGRIREALPAETALIGFAGAPWTVAAYMVEGGTSRDFHAIKSWALTDPDGFGQLMDLLVVATAEHLSRQVAAGADAVQIFDSHAGVLPDGAFEKWIIEPTARIVASLRETHPTVPIIGFPRGAGLRYSDYAAKTGITAVGLDSVVPVAWARDALQPKLPVQGNLDPVYLLAGGTKMLDATDRILDALGDGPMIFNLGHGVIKETPPDHVTELVEHVRNRRG